MPKRTTLTDKMRRRIIEATRHGGTTQGDIARRLGVSDKTIWRVLREAERAKA